MRFYIATTSPKYIASAARSVLLSQLQHTGPSQTLFMLTVTMSLVG